MAEQAKWKLYKLMHVKLLNQELSLLDCKILFVKCLGWYLYCESTYSGENKVLSGYKDLVFLSFSSLMILAKRLSDIPDFCKTKSILVSSTLYKCAYL